MIGQKFILLDEVDSTNNYAAKLLGEGKLAHGTVILAEKQTAGRGQRGNSWSSKAGNQFACTVYAETAFLAAADYRYLNLAVALAARETLQSYTTYDVKIKWPNDLLICNKKTAGILIEAQWRSGTMQGAIIGVGINLHAEEQLPSSGALSGFTENVPVPLTLAQELALQLERQFVRLKQQQWEAILSEYHGHLWSIGQQLTAKTSDETLISGTIRGIDDTGNLLFETTEGVRSFGLQEIKFTY